MRLQPFFVSLTLLALAACRSSQPLPQPAAEAVAAPAPKMVFLSFKIQSDSSQVNKMTLLSKKSVDGRMKAQPEKEATPDRLVVSLVGKDHRVLHAENIPHPLFRDVETTNSRGEFERKKVTLTDAEFFVRLRLPEGSDWVLVEEFVGNQRVNSAEFYLNP